MASTSLAPQPPSAEQKIPLAARSDAAPALAVDSLRRSYEKLEAVRGISFEIRAGEVFGLLGPNGAGKTTTISVLSTRLRPSGGGATVFGHDIRADVAAVRRSIGLVPQEISIYPTLTAAENVRFFGRMYGVKPPTVDERVDQLLELVGLTARRDDRAATFSGGMKRRLNLAVSLVHQPRLLLLDEPTAGVDPHSRQHIFEIIRDLRRRGTAILYTTHYMEEAETLCDRLGVMDEGRIVALGTLRQLLATMGGNETVAIRGVPPQEITGHFGGHPLVREIDVAGDLCRLFVADSKKLLGALQQVLEKHPAASLEISPMSLGDLFLHLTGKELRD
jgi:ABC-2 type transport system ATP-binding protein